MMIELVAKRQENSKRYKLDSRREQLVVSIGAIHYKDDYASNEQWKDIDLTWEGNRITKAPYELTHEDRKLTIRDKRSGEVSTIELLEGATPDVDIEVVPEFSRVRFTRVLKSKRAPKEAKFKVTGNWRVRASDEDGEIPVESILKDDILTETLKPDRPVKYPVRIDPTWQVGASSDDCYRKLTTPVWEIDNSSQMAGSFSGSSYQYGGGMRFTNITIAQGAIIDIAKLTFRARTTLDSADCNTRISAENVDDAITFADDSGAFDTRWANRTTARVDWDGIGAWTINNDYDSPEIKTVIQEIVDRPGWQSGYAIAPFWEDFEDRSNHATDNRRTAYSYDGSAEFAPKLVIVFTPPAVRAASLRGGGWFVLKRHRR